MKRPVSARAAARGKARMLPLVDVVICTNRQSPFLQAAVDSVIRQTWSEWHIILVDDGTPPEIARNLREFAGSLPNLTLVRQEALGISAARNAGARAGRGEFLSFLDDDDVWLPERLRIQMKALQDAPWANGVYSGGWYLGADGTPWGHGWAAQPAPAAKFLDGSAPLPLFGTVTLRRAAWSRIGGFNENYRLGEDLDFLLRLVTDGELIAVPGELFGYRRHTANTTNAPLMEQRRAVLSILADLIADAERRGDEGTAADLRTNRRRYLGSAGHQSVGALITFARNRDPNGFARELVWAATHTPVGTARAAVARVSRRRVAS